MKCHVDLAIVQVHILVTASICSFKPSSVPFFPSFSCFNDVELFTVSIRQSEMLFMQVFLVNCEGNLLAGLKKPWRVAMFPRVL